MCHSVFQNPPICQCGQGHFEARSPIQETGRVVMEPAEATGFLGEELHPLETLAPAANSAAYAYTARKSSGSS